MRAILSIVPITLMLAAAACSRTESNVAAVPPNPVPAAVSSPPPPPSPEPVTTTASIGKRFRVRTISALSTKTAKNGEAFQAVLAEPLVVDGVTLARAGAAVTGIVASSDPGGRVKGVASIALRAVSLVLVNGQSVDLVTSSHVSVARHTKKKDALKIGIGSGIGAAIGAIAGGGQGAAIGAGAGAGAGTGAVLATRGDPAVIPSESLLTFTLRRPVSMVRYISQVPGK